MKTVYLVKLLDVIFDSRQNWNDHIKYFKSKLQRILHFLRPVSRNGSDASSIWPANNDSVVNKSHHWIWTRIVRQILQRPVTYYRPHNYVQLQCHLVRICSGTCQRIHSIAIEVGLDEPPLQLRHLQRQIELVAKVEAGERPFSSINVDHRSNYCSNSNLNKQSLWVFIIKLNLSLALSLTSTTGKSSLVFCDNYNCTFNNKVC